MRWALDRAKQVAGVKVQTTQYHTNPLYNKKVISGWRARQSIRLESESADQLSDLIGELPMVALLWCGGVHAFIAKAHCQTGQEGRLALLQSGQGMGAPLLGIGDSALDRGSAASKI